MRGRLLTLCLSSDLYRALAAQAREHERDPAQESRYLLKQALAPLGEATKSAADLPSCSGDEPLSTDR
jgi:hypothetical protein